MSSTNFSTALPPASVAERVLFSASVRMLGLGLHWEDESLTPLPSGDYDSPLLSPAWRTWQIRAQMDETPANEREAFEKAYRTLLGSPMNERFARGSQDEYLVTHLDIAWRTWQHRAVLDAWQRLSAVAPASTHSSRAPAEGVTG